MPGHKQSTNDTPNRTEPSAAMHHEDPAYWTDKTTVIAAVIICVAVAAGALAILWATKAG